MGKILNTGREWDWMDSLEKDSIELSQETRDQFVRLAEARLRSRYKFKPQRRAIAAKMYIKWLDKKVIMR